MNLSWITRIFGGITLVRSTEVMDKLPKVLVTTLTELCNEQDIISWNVGAKENIVSVNIRFAEHGHAMNMQGSRSGATYMTGMRGKSPGQLRRDHMRFNSYRREALSMMDLSTGETENERNDDQVINQRQVYEPQSFTPDSSTPINSSAIHAHVDMEQSPAHEDEGRVQSSDQQVKTKTKAHGIQKYEVNISGDQGMDTLLSPDHLPGTHDADTIDPSVHFCKVIADFRSITHFTTLRGLTKTGEIACYVPNKKHKFYVLYEYDMYNQYNTEYGRAIEIMNRFDDQRQEDYWKNDIQELCKHWEMYTKEMNSDKTSFTSTY